MSDRFHRYAKGTDPGRFADGPAESARVHARTRFGCGEILASNLTEEGAKARCRTSDGAAVRLVSDSANEHRKANPRIVRIEEVRDHSGPRPIEARRTDLLPEEREPW